MSKGQFNPNEVYNILSQLPGFEECDPYIIKSRIILDNNILTWRGMYNMANIIISKNAINKYKCDIKLYGVDKERIVSLSRTFYIYKTFKLDKMIYRIQIIVSALKLFTTSHDVELDKILGLIK